MKGREYKTEEKRRRMKGTNLVLGISKSQSPRTKPDDVFSLINFVCLASFIKSNPMGNHLIRQSPGFQPSLYKSIGWAFLGLSPYLYKW